MKSKLFAVSLLLLAVHAGWAQEPKYPKAKVSFDDFKGLVSVVEKHRASRLVDLNTFLKMSKEEGTIIFDSRSDFRFDRIHLKGAKHLAFTDFTQDNLNKLIPNPNTRILIYCNNNFEGNQKDFASKIAVMRPNLGKAATTQFAAQAKPLMMALNIPTYINLYGYGFRNVYELDELVKVSDPRIAFEGTIVGQNPPLTSKDLSGAWKGEKDGVKIQIVFGGNSDATWRVDTESAGINCQLQRVDNKQLGTVELQYDYINTATGKRGSEAIGRIERGKDGVLQLTVLRVATKFTAEYKPVERVLLTKVKEQ